LALDRLEKPLVHSWRDQFGGLDLVISRLAYTTLLQERRDG
jgi:hypothetical protein